MLKKCVFMLLLILLDGCGSQRLNDTDTPLSETPVNTIAPTPSAINETPNLTGPEITPYPSVDAPIPSANDNIHGSMTENDFDILYRDVVLNDRVSLKEVFEKLNIVSENNDNIELRAGITSNGNDYMWNILYCPSKKNKELQIDYVIDEQAQTMTLVYVELLKVETHRGIRVGDELNKLLTQYGEDVKGMFNREGEDYYRYAYFRGEKEMSISIIVDTLTQTVTNVGVDYGVSEMLDMLGIPTIGA